MILWWEKVYFRANIFIPDIQEEMLPQMKSLQYRYSLLYYNDDTIDDNSFMLVDV